MGERLIDRMQEAVDERELVECARRLVRTPSVTGHERAVMDVAADWLRGRGLRVRPVARDPERPNLVVDVGRDSGPLLAFNGHLDTVPVASGETWTHEPFGGAVQDGRLYGRGALDMKGACAAMM